MRANQITYAVTRINFGHVEYLVAKSQVSSDCAECASTVVFSSRFSERSGVISVGQSDWLRRNHAGPYHHKSNDLSSEFRRPRDAQSAGLLTEDMYRHLT